MEPSPDRIAILLPLGIAVSITFCTVIIHALAMMPMIYFVHYELRLGPRRRPVWRDVAIVAGATLVALSTFGRDDHVGHGVQLMRRIFPIYGSSLPFRNELHDAR
jgi:hypothetical protein